MHFTLFQDGKSVIINLQTLLNHYDEFILISNREDKELIFNYFKIPVLIVSGYAYDGNYEPVSSMMSELFICYPSIVFDGNKGYQKFKIASEVDEEYKENAKRLKDIFGYHDVAKSSKKKLFLNIWEGKEEFDIIDNDSAFINYNHHFFNFVFSNYQQISENSEYFKIVKAAFNFMSELQDEDSISRDSLKRLNEILSPLNKIVKFKSITSGDF